MSVLAGVLLLAQSAPFATPRCELKEVNGMWRRAGTDRECRPWRAPRERTGVWLYAFEGSQFVEDATTLAEASAAKMRKPRVSWLSTDARSSLPRGRRPQLGQAYFIQFTGRDALPQGELGAEGGFGHMGLWSSEVLLDRATIMRDLGPLRGRRIRADPRQCVATD